MLSWAVLSFGLLGDGFSIRRTGFDPMLVHVSFMVHKVARGKISL
jgi:hypothetical protein